MHNARAITTCSANQRPNTPCIRLWIDVIFRGDENSYTAFAKLWSTALAFCLHFDEAPTSGWYVCFLILDYIKFDSKLTFESSDR